jgi:hypothetical protein
MILEPKGFKTLFQIGRNNLLFSKVRGGKED